MNETRNMTRQRPQSASRGIGAGLSTLLLTLGNLATSYLLLLAYAAEPAGPWDGETVAHSNFAAGLALALAVATALRSPRPALASCRVITVPAGRLPAIRTACPSGARVPTRLYLLAAS
ncbi:hypothetical protein ABT237_35405 [Streptomyces sp. NPDC001581]|uniref:hypothetical protein n=1 Tax=Streptomyces sp. NPDC001581 TaxID=3154386 RepID=UPI003316B434